MSKAAQGAKSSAGPASRSARSDRAGRRKGSGRGARTAEPAAESAAGPGNSEAEADRITAEAEADRTSAEAEAGKKSAGAKAGKKSAGTKAEEPPAGTKADDATGGYGVESAGKAVGAGTPELSTSAGAGEDEGASAPQKAAAFPRVPAVRIATTGSADPSAVPPPQRETEGEAAGEPVMAAAQAAPAAPAGRAAKAQTPAGASGSSGPARTARRVTSVRAGKPASKSSAAKPAPDSLPSKPPAKPAPQPGGAPPRESAQRDGPAGNSEDRDPAASRRAPSARQRGDAATPEAARAVKEVDAATAQRTGQEESATAGPEEPTAAAVTPGPQDVVDAEQPTAREELTNPAGGREEPAKSPAARKDRAGRKAARRRKKAKPPREDASADTPASERAAAPEPAKPTAARREPGRTRSMLRRIPRWWPVPLCLALGAAGGAVYSAASPPQYAAMSYVVVSPDGRADAASALGYAQAYGKVATDPVVLAAAEDRAKLRRGTLSDSVEATTSPDAPMVQITATSPRPGQAAKNADAVAKALAGTAKQSVKRTGARLTVLSDSVAPAKPVSPSSPIAVAVGGCAGGLIGGLVLLARPQGGRRPSRDGSAAEAGLPGGRATAVPGPAPHPPEHTTAATGPGTEPLPAGYGSTTEVPR